MVAGSSGNSDLKNFYYRDKFARRAHSEQKSYSNLASTEIDSNSGQANKNVHVHMHIEST